MALFTDGPLSTIEDLTGHDSQLMDVASTEGIDVGRKLTLAQEELGMELAALLGSAANADAALWMPAADLSHVAATPALKAYHVFRTLEMVYRDAYHSQLNDRYAGRRDAFGEQAGRAREKLIQAGVGIAWKPVARAVTPVVDTTQGNTPAGLYYVSTAWVNDRGEEGAGAIPAVATISGGALRVSAGAAPQNAIGWNVFVGDADATLRLQNTSPIAAGQSWTQPGAVTTTGRAPGEGQQPNYLQPVPRTIQRG